MWRRSPKLGAFSPANEMLRDPNSASGRATALWLRFVGVFADQRDAIERGARTSAGTPDFSLLVNGLAAEREQGITIDIAWRYFELPARRLVIIESPGHVEYTRNMATGASHADVALLRVDARAGVKEQTRRHLAIC